MADYTTTVPGVANFPHLFDVDQKSGKYSLTVLLDKSDPQVAGEVQKLMMAVKDAVKEGIDGRQGSGGNNYAPFAGHRLDDAEWMSGLLLPVEDGDKAVFTRGEHKGKLKKDVYPELAGKWILRTNTPDNLSQAGVIVDTQRRPLKPNDIYSGALVRVKVWLYPYKQDNLGVGARLRAVVKTGDGERLANGGGDPLDGFGLPAEAPADPLGGMI